MMRLETACPWPVVLMAFALAGCAAPTGDFGRPVPSYFHDKALPLLGRELARERGEPVSYFMLTDEEKELRARSYRLVMPIHRRGFFAQAETELVRARIWSDEAYRVDASLYYRKLRSDGYASSVARYNAVESEVLSDILLIEPFFGVALSVCLGDAERVLALDATADLTPDEQADAVGRIYENRRVVEWALTGLRWRVESYGYALARSRIEVPSPSAISADLALARLEEKVEALDAAVGQLDCRPVEKQIGIQHEWRPLAVKR